MKKRRKSPGFTLIELLIAIVIIGILAAVAVPSYMNSVRKSNRAEAKTELMNDAQRLQVCYTAYAQYNSPNCDIYKKLTAGIYTTPNGYYLVKISFDPALSATNSFKLTASAVKDPQLKDTANNCNSLSLTHTGIKGDNIVCW